MGEGSILQMASGAVVLDSENGVLQIKDANNLATGDYIRMETGELSTYSYINGKYVALKSLRQIAHGEATNGALTTIGGTSNPVVFANTPEIIVSPATIQTYSPNYSTQPQTLRCYADNISRNPTTGIVTFVPRADLVIQPQIVTDDTLRTAYTSWGTNNQVGHATPITVTLNITGLPIGATNVRIDIETACNDWYLYNFYGYAMETTLSLIATNGSQSINVASADEQKLWYSARRDYSGDATTKYFPSMLPILGEGNIFPDCEHYFNFDQYFLETYSEYGWKNFTKKYTATFDVLTSSQVILQATCYQSINKYTKHFTEIWYSPNGWDKTSGGCIAVTRIQYQQAATTQLAAGTLNYTAIAE